MKHIWRNIRRQNINSVILSIMYSPDNQRNVFFIHYTFIYECCNVYYCIIYISLTIIKYYVLTCFDKNKITGAFRPKVEHCDFAVGALRLSSRGIATGAFRQWGIATIIH